MGTTYQVPNLASASYDTILHHSAYASTLPQQRNANSADSSSSSATYVSSRSSHRPPPPSTVASSVTLANSSRQSSTRPPTPVERLSERDQAMVQHSMNIPKCISPRGGDLADFAADITAMLWFESPKVVEAAENMRALSPRASVPPLHDNAVASEHFRKWVQSVLSTTQVTQNVILLSLMFVFRLKKSNPAVRGKQGSEYRLLTVALMLGNKFLDDNTYTNKTWADVSGIPVQEIHVMEVEFLSNMRYSLLASKEQWEEWLVKLAKLREYIERAKKAAREAAQQRAAIKAAAAERAAISPPSKPIPPPTQNYASPLPSPTHAGNLGYLTLTAPYASSNGITQLWPPSAAQPAPSPLALKPEPGMHRKRGFPEEDPTEPCAKRPNLGRQSYPTRSTMPQAQPQRPVAPQAVQQQPARLQAVPKQQQPVQHQAVAHAPRPAPIPKPVPSQTQTRLSVPNLTINTSQASVPQQPVSFAASNNFVPQQASALSLPPLVPGVRAMSTVYPQTTYSSQLPVLSTTGPSVTTPSVAAPAVSAPTASQPVVTPTTNYPPMMSYGTPSKRLSPQHAPFTSSPITDSFPHHGLGTASGVHTPISHSPSVYLQQRPSPYKPVRHVNTLLYPPPSAFLQQYHLANSIPPTHMHYQPLGRRNEVRTGVVPEYMMAGHQYGGGMHHAPAVTPAKLHPMQAAQDSHGYRPAPAQSHYPPN